MNLKQQLDDIRSHLHAPTPKLKQALAVVDAIEAAHCRAPVPAVSTVKETAAVVDKPMKDADKK